VEPEPTAVAISLPPFDKTAGRALIDSAAETKTTVAIPAHTANMLDTNPPHAVDIAPVEESDKGEVASEKLERGESEGDILEIETLEEEPPNSRFKNSDGMNDKDIEEVATILDAK